MRPHEAAYGDYPSPRKTSWRLFFAGEYTSKESTPWKMFWPAAFTLPGKYRRTSMNNEYDAIVVGGGHNGSDRGCLFGKGWAESAGIGATLLGRWRGRI